MRWCSSTAIGRGGWAIERRRYGPRRRPKRDTWAEGRLSAPLEAHLQLTNRCDAGCQGCYTGASPTGAPANGALVEWKRAIDALAARGVFHLALGGGESALLPWLGEVARARARARHGART